MTGLTFPEMESLDIRDMCADASTIIPAITSALDGQEPATALLALATVAAAVYATLPGAGGPIAAEVFCLGFASAIRSEIDGAAENRGARQ